MQAATSPPDAPPTSPAQQLPPIYYILIHPIGVLYRLHVTAACHLSSPGALQYRFGACIPVPESGRQDAVLHKNVFGVMPPACTAAGLPLFTAGDCSKLRFTAVCPDASPCCTEARPHARDSQRLSLHFFSHQDASHFGRMLGCAVLAQGTACAWAPVQTGQAGNVIWRTWDPIRILS